MTSTSDCTVCTANQRTFRRTPADASAHGLPVHAGCARELDHAAETRPQARLDGDVLRWASNDQCPFDDMTGLWVALGLATPAQHDATRAAREDDTAAFLASYRAAQTPAGPAERAEMRAAFGPGTVVDVITGRRTRL